MIKFLIPSWRPQLLLDAYDEFPDGEAVNSKVTDAYVELAKARGHSLPKTRAGLEAGIRNTQQRLSSDSKEFQGRWPTGIGPDLLQKLEPGRWGLREPVWEENKYCKIHAPGKTLLTAIPVLVAPPKQLAMDFLNENEAYDTKDVYVLKAQPPPGHSIPEGKIMVKIGIGNTYARVKSCQTGNPYRIEVLYNERAVNARAVENILHTYMAKNRQAGGTEWFCSTESELIKIGAIIQEHRLDIR